MHSARLCYAFCALFTLAASVSRADAPAATGASPAATPAAVVATPAPAAPAVETPDTGDLQRQLAEAQDKLSMALRSYTMLQDENTRLKTEADALRSQLRQAQDQVSSLASENSKLRIRLSVRGASPAGSLPVPTRPPTP